MSKILLKNGLQTNVADAIARKGEVLIALDSSKLYVGTNDNGGVGSTDKIQITDVIFVTNYASLPVTGSVDKLYISKADKKSYVWNGASYDLLTTDLTQLILDTATSGNTTHTYSADKIISLLTGKADKVTGATADDVAILDANGNLVDSGKKLSSYVTLVGIETITNKTIDADNNTISNIELDNFKTGVIDTDVTLASDSDTKLATQKAVKDYVDTKTSSLASGLLYKGILDASNSTNLPSTIKQGDFYKISVAGVIETVDLQIGDMLIANTTKSSDITIADFDKIDNTESSDIIRTGDISTNTDLSVDGTKLTDRATIKNKLDNKADKVVSAVNGNFAGLDVNGNLTDSGSKASDFATPSDLTGFASKIGTPTEDNILVQSATGDLKDSTKKLSDYALKTDLDIIDGGTF